MHPQEQSLESQNNLDSRNNNNTQEQSQIKKSLGNLKKYKIQEVIKPGQVILIQVLKDERGLKGAALTTFVSLAGKYIVLMPNTSKGGGISRKIFNPDDRRKIRSILKEIQIPRTMGLIVRTAGLNKTKNDIDKDLKMEGLVREIIRHIQVMRKDAGFDVDDRIILSNDFSKDIINAIEKYNEYFMNEILCLDIVDKMENSDYNSIFDYEGKSFNIYIKKESSK